MDENKHLLGSFVHLLRHNLDIRHIEKKIFENIFNIVMNVSGKVKENEKAQVELSLYCMQRDLELKSHPIGKMFKLKSNYTLAVDQMKHMCHWLKDLRMLVK